MQVHMGTRTSHIKFEHHSSMRETAPVGLLSVAPSPKLSVPALARALSYDAQILCVMFEYPYALELASFIKFWRSAGPTKTGKWVLFGICLGYRHRSIPKSWYRPLNQANKKIALFPFWRENSSFDLAFYYTGNGFRIFVPKRKKCNFLICLILPCR